MSKTSVTVRGGGIGLCGVFFIVLFVLKILGHLDWSWWWVTAPLWGPLGLVCALCIVVLAGAAIVGVAYLALLAISKVGKRRG